MDIIDYPFIKTGQADSRPSLFIRLESSSAGGFQDTTALIDTGATQCCVPSNFSESLHINLTSGEKKIVRTASGVTEAFVHRLRLIVWDTFELYKDNKVLVHDVPDLRVYFVNGLRDILLGASFLDEYVLNVDYHNKVFSLTES